MDNASIDWIYIVFWDPYVGVETKNIQMNYARKDKDPLMASYIVNNSSHGARNVQPITFTQEDVSGLYYPHYKALIVRVVVAHNKLKKMLVGNGSSINILFGLPMIRCSWTMS